MRSGLSRKDIETKADQLLNTLFRNIPSGVGSRRKDFKLSRKELQKVLIYGAKWAIDHGFGFSEDLEHIEARGCIKEGNPELISQRAMERGRPQLGTLGSGNHFVEVGYVDQVYDQQIANVLGLEKGGATVLVHTGSRGLGHQVCDDFIRLMIDASKRYGIELLDRQLCCAPVDSKEGQKYLSAMACAANFAFVNRQMISHWVRESFAEVFQLGPRDLQLDLIYDVCHNIAKLETHEITGKQIEVCVHRKGATRAFPPGHKDIPTDYREIGQPVFIPGDMGRYSYVLVGTEKAYKETFGSTCHGAGRVMSRHQAKKAAKGRSIEKELQNKGIIVRGNSRDTLAEEIPEAYKDIKNVVGVVHSAGISKKVVRLKPLCVIKG